jgi:hypothetical protein
MQYHLEHTYREHGICCWQMWIGNPCCWQMWMASTRLLNQSSALSSTRWNRVVQWWGIIVAGICGWPPSCPCWSSPPPCLVPDGMQWCSGGASLLLANVDGLLHAPTDMHSFSVSSTWWDTVVVGCSGRVSASWSRSCGFNYWPSGHLVFLLVKLMWALCICSLKPQIDF